MQSLLVLRDEAQHRDGAAVGSLVPKRTALAITAVYGIISLAKALAHGIWLDESQAWLIAKASSSPIDVARNVRQEGHPMLWHLLLWVLTRATHDPRAMQIFSALIATGTAWLVLSRGPFPPLLSVAFLLGPFPFYEYNTIARPYTLELFLVALACSIAQRRPFRSGAVAAVLALLCFTTLFGALVAALVWAALLLNDAVYRGSARRTVRDHWRPSLFLAAAGGIAALEALLPKTAFRNDTLSGAPRARGGQRAVADVFFGDIEDIFRNSTNWLVQHPVVGAGLVLVSAVTVAAWLAAKPAALTLWLVGAPAIVAATTATGLVGPRHRGHTVLVFLAACWLARFGAPWPPRRDASPFTRAASAQYTRAAAALMPLLLVVSAVLGVAVSVHDVAQPLLPWRETADWMKAEGHRDDTFIVDAPDQLNPILALLDRKAIITWDWSVGDYAKWNEQRTTPENEVVARSRAIAAASSKPTLLLLYRPLQLNYPDIVQLTTFDNRYHEVMVTIYRVDAHRAN